MYYNFEWDPYKAKINKKKHDISFEEATEVFLDPLQINLLDDNKRAEERWLALGQTKAHKLLVVVHTYIEYYDNNVTIRIISARKATNHEKKQYEDL